IVDLETTGVDYRLDRILEIGAVRLVDGVAEEEFHALIDPGVELRDSNIAIHGITPDMIKGCPQIEEILPQFLEFLADDPLAAHNVLFDFNFLNHNAQRILKKELDFILIDTMTLAKEVFPRERSLSLERLLQLLDRSTDGLHRALADARALAGIFFELFNCYETKLAWHRSRFGQVAMLAARYLQLGELIEELRHEEGEARRTLELFFNETETPAVTLPGGVKLRLDKRENWEFKLDEVRATLAGTGILDQVTRIDRSKLNSYLKGEYLSPGQKEAILATRRFLGYRQQIVVDRK
ncbi:MAG: 3'-5' exonuclease, partial [Cyanobacteria bacterium NC_groundwater_1444_Ag_S-0.65um_54_12]|nr:3'-5' exonuclease [Cyanobacteria bacterium NC_groundwater_1444_Ag_S-0.65um_54_12]